MSKTKNTAPVVDESVPAPAPPPEMVPCGVCDQGLVTCSVCGGSGERKRNATGLRIRDPLLVRAEQQRDGWREIANALMATAFSGDIGSPTNAASSEGPWSDVPPTELLDGIRGSSKDAIDAAAAVRDAVLGRAWRVGGSRGNGTCDYPLCPHRPKTIEERIGYARQRSQIPLIDAHSMMAVAHLTVCAPTAAVGRNSVVDEECHKWAQWVAARIRAGRITVQR